MLQDTHLPIAPSFPGEVTGVSLNDLDSLLVPFAQDPFFYSRPAFRLQAVRLSAELAQLPYSLHLDQWAKAGWMDFSIQMDHNLYSSINLSNEKDTFKGWIDSAQVTFAKASLRNTGLIPQIIGSLRHKQQHNTLKAVVMLHPVAGGKFLVAVGFMGTGKRIFDWFSNLRISTNEGFHEGFSHLAAYFENISDKILFPSTATSLGMETLTLKDIFTEMRSYHSRFRLWMAGHSQGSAVMQVLTHRLMMQQGVLPQNIIGYGFASPTCATGSFVYNPAAYPLYHILNKDDLITRMGSLLHLGLCLEYTPDISMHNAILQKPVPEKLQPAYEALHPFFSAMTDGPSTLLYGYAMLCCLRNYLSSLANSTQRQSTLSVIYRFFVDSFQLSGESSSSFLNRFIDYVSRSYFALLSKPVCEDECSAVSASFLALLKEHSVSDLLAACEYYVYIPHTLTRKGEEGAYSYIAKNALSRLIPFYWQKQKGSLPVKKYGQSYLLENSFSAIPQRFSCTKQAASTIHLPYSKGKLRKSYTANRYKVR